MLQPELTEVRQGDAPVERLGAEIDVSAHLDNIHAEVFSWQGSPKGEAYEQLFDADVSNLLGLCQDETARRAVQTVSDTVRWYLFAGVGDPLPDNLCIVKCNDGTLAVDVHPDFRVEPRLQSEIVTALTQTSSTYKWLEGEIDRVQGDAILTPEISKIICASETYNFLKSFDANSPQPNEVPITPWMRWVREAQIEADVREQFKIPRNLAVTNKTAADWALQKALYQLDEETMPGSEQSKDASPAQRYIQYLCDAYNQVEANDKDFIPLRKLGYDHDEGRITTNGFVSELTTAKLRNVLYQRNLDYKAGGYSNMVTLVEELEITFLIKLLEHPEMSYGQVLEQSVQEVIDDKNGISITDAWRKNTLVKADLEWLRRPSGQIIEEDDYHAARTARPAMQGAIGFGNKVFPGVTDQWSIEGQYRQTAGTVERRQTNDRALRLLIDAKVTSERSMHADGGDQDLIIDMSNYVSGGPTSFSVPGYELITSSHGRYAFTSAEHDPYALSGIEVPEADLALLLKEYTKIGLFDLVHDITAADHLTVDRLAQLVKAHSDYTYDKDYITKVPESIADFKKVIKGGRLQVQCSGAASFFSYSLDGLFGERASRTISGMMLQPTSNRVPWVNHAQTALSHKGKMYMYDTTPPGDGLLEDPRYLRHNQATEYTPDIVPYHESYGDPTDLIGPAVEIEYLSEAEVETAQQELQRQNSKEALEMQLCAPLGVNNVDQMYKKLVELSKDDPLRRAMKLVSMAARGEVDRIEIERTLAFIQNYPEQGSPILKRHHLKAYKAEVLANAARALSSL